MMDSDRLYMAIGEDDLEQIGSKAYFAMPLRLNIEGQKDEFIDYFFDELKKYLYEQETALEAVAIRYLEENWDKHHHPVED